MTNNNEKNENKEVTKKSSTALTWSSTFEEDAGSGLENITSEDLTIPRLKILQALSPEVNKRDGKYIEGAVAGDTLNTVTKELYHEDTGCVVIPVSYRRIYLEWQPRESGGGLVNQHFDSSILKETTQDNSYRNVLPSGNYVQTSASHFALVIDESGSYQQVMIAMAGTQLKKSRTWNSVMSSIKVKSSKGNIFTPPSYSHKYKLTTVAESNDRGTWFGWNIDLVGAISEEELSLYEAAKHFASTINIEGSVGSTEQEAPF